MESCVEHKVRSLPRSPLNLDINVNSHRVPHIPMEFIAIAYLPWSLERGRKIADFKS
jgi:hypothetical protein